MRRMGSIWVVTLRTSSFSRREKNWRKFSFEKNDLANIGGLARSRLK